MLAKPGETRGSRTALLIGLATKFTIMIVNHETYLLF